jgi:hypothetical protein
MALRVWRMSTAANELPSTKAGKMVVCRESQKSSKGPT